MASIALDLKGLVCPLPVLRANKAIKALAPGDLLEIAVTDPAAPADFRAYCETTGHELLDCREDADVFAIVLRKRP
ncbi:MAG: sulfurtransferase TusA family protein [Rhodospirillales bacterium]|nr:sulfurtransferase TusA family protein [Rhodospirillales bacterium]